MESRTSRYVTGLLKCPKCGNLHRPPHPSYKADEIDGSFVGELPKELANLSNMAELKRWLEADLAQRSQGKTVGGLVWGYSIWDRPKHHRLYELHWQRVLKCQYCQMRVEKGMLKCPNCSAPIKF